MTHCHLPASTHAGFFHGYSHDRPSASDPRVRRGGALSAGGARFSSPTGRGRFATCGNSTCYRRAVAAMASGSHVRTTSAARPATGLPACCRLSVPTSRPSSGYAPLPFRPAERSAACPWVRKARQSRHPIPMPFPRMRRGDTISVMSRRLGVLDSKPSCKAQQLVRGYDRLRLPQSPVRANRPNKASPFMTGPLCSSGDLESDSRLRGNPPSPIRRFRQML
jgi:hypothetical protein